MQVQPQPHQEIVDNKKTQQSFVLQQGADLSIDESLLREGVGPRCYYCWTKTGYSVIYTTLGQYVKHVIHNHEGYSIYVFDEDVDKFKEELRALRKKERDYPKLFRQPPGVNTDTKYNMKYSLYYEKNGHKKINSLASDQPG